MVRDFNRNIGIYIGNNMGINIGNNIWGINIGNNTVPALAKGVTQKAQNIKGAKVKLGEGAKIRRKRKSYLNR